MQNLRGNPSPLILSLLSFTRVAWALAVAMLLLADVARGDIVTLRPSKDTTIYSDGNPPLSNGAGAFLFAGSSGEKRVLRSLIAFNLSGQIPSGATINSVTLTLSVNTPLTANANTV